MLSLEQLVRGKHEKMTDDDVRVHVGTALHEAAHFVAAGYCRGCINSVEINPAGTRTRGRRAGTLGRVNSALLLPSEDAFDAFVGYAWEEMYGDVTHAAHDMNEGLRLAQETAESSDDIMAEARQFVRREELKIRGAAAAILAAMPKSGILKGRALTKIILEFATVRPEHARARPAARLRVPVAEKVTWTHGPNFPLAELDEVLGKVPP